MKYTLILCGLLIVACGCSTLKHGSTPLSQSATLGPFCIEYGKDGTNDTLRLTKGNELLYSKSGNKISVYADGRSLFDYASTRSGHVVAAYMVHIRDAQGKIAFTLMDENADGVFDRKIDYGTKAAYVWKDNQWVSGE